MQASLIGACVVCVCLRVVCEKERVIKGLVSDLRQEVCVDAPADAYESAPLMFFSPRVPGPSPPSCPHTPTLPPSPLPFHLHSLSLVNTHAHTRAHTHLTATNCLRTQRGFPLSIYLQSCIEPFHLFLRESSWTLKTLKLWSVLFFLQAVWFLANAVI